MLYIADMCESSCVSNFELKCVSTSMRIDDVFCIIRISNTALLVKALWTIC